MSENVLEKVRALMALALDERTPKNEATAAAFTALRRIQNENLLDLHEKASKRAVPSDHIRVQAHFLIIQETPAIFRYCVMTRDTKSRGSSLYGAWPRSVVHDYTLLSDDAKKALYGASGRVTDTIVIDRSFFERLEKQGVVRRV